MRLSGARVFLAIFLCGLALRVGVAVRDLDVIDRMFIPDDTYYTLAIARSIAAGSGPTVDGVRTTNGFQPLLAFLMVPVFWVTTDPDLALRVDLLLLALVDALTILLLAKIGRRIGGSFGAGVAAALWAVSPVALANALGGLETALALACCLALVEQWCRCHERPATARYLFAGGLAGLSLLARVDSVFLVAALGAGELLWGNRRGALLAAAAAVVVVAPWWIYSLVHFQTVIPESGAAVRDQVALHQARHLSLARQLGWAATTLVGPPIVDAQTLRDLVYQARWPGIPIFLLVFAAVADGARRLLRACEPAGRIGFAALGIHAGAIILFYAFVLPALWFFRRYLAPAHLLLTLIAAWVLARLWRARVERPGPARAGALALGAGLLVSLALSLLPLLLTPRETVEHGLHGAKGYREVARGLVAALPAGTTIGAFQSGALAYYGAPRIRVVNLDGVVDGQAAAAFRERRLAAYARERGATLIVDWPFNLKAFVDHSAKGTRLRVIGRARPQGEDRFLIAELPRRRTP